MPERYLYEYAVIRVLPKIEREEFLNVGVIVFSKQAKFIKMLYRLDEERLKIFSDKIDIDQLTDILEGYEKIATGSAAGGYIATFDIPERFRWITSVKSSCVQTSRPHPGFSSDLEKTTGMLFEELVL